MSSGPQQDHRERLKSAVRALQELQAKLDASERARREPIAVVGMACRFPGGGADPGSFWRLLRGGTDAVTEVPPERWSLEDYYDPDPEAPGKMYTRSGAFLDDVDRFDARFFGVAPLEAAGMDPQQRLFLEVAWEALEDAGLAPERLAGSPTGVFAGISTTDYLQLRVQSFDPRAIDAYVGTGCVHGAAPGRLAYLLGLTGPALAVDTACSSALVATHLACGSLRTGECELALVGGVNLLLSPVLSINFSRARMMSASGRCRTFDAAADGYVRGEGCGVLVLERLSRARERGHRVLAVLRGSAVNQDGRSSGFTAPNGPSQEALIRSALAASGVEPAEVGYVEAHGTGTSLGDPIEVQALGAALAPGRPADRPVVVGSVKTNVGHLEAAAGMAGLIKVILALQHGEIPPHLHFETPNPHIPWDELPVEVATSPVAWPRGDGRRVAGVSSFGFIGTNAHVVVEEAPAEAEEGEAAAAAPGPHLLTLSARSPEALAALAGRYREHLGSARGEAHLADAAYTTQVGRSHLPQRLAVTAGSLAQARERLAAAAAGGGGRGVARCEVRPGVRPRVAFLFTGQGSQYPGMGRGLYETEAVFRRVVDHCDELLRPHLEVPLLEVLYPGEGGDSPVDETLYAQPALFAVEVALAELWRSWGVAPAAVFGHSVGEYAAACCAGVLRLEDAARLVAERARRMQALPAAGAMAAVFAAEDAVVAALEESGVREVAPAAFNGPRETVISGPQEAVDAVLERLAAAGVKARRLRVSRAFHSPSVEPALAGFDELVAEVELGRARPPLVPGVTGRPDSDGVVSRPDYWRRQAREPVRFADAVASLAGAGCSLFLEIGPEPHLAAMGRRCLAQGLWLPSLRRKRDDRGQLLESLGELYTRGVAVDWEGLHRGQRRRRVALPTYPFQGERYWMEPARTPLQAQEAAAGDPLQGRRLRSPLLDGAAFATELGPDSPPLLDDHRLSGRPVVPAAAWAVMALRALRETGSASGALTDLTFAEPLALAGGGRTTVHLALSGNGKEDGSFEISSLDDAGDGERWTVHATGRYGPAPEETGKADLHAARARCPRVLEGDHFYRGMGAVGIGYGPAFRWIRRLYRGDGEAVAELAAPTGENPEEGGLHPGLLDACFQAVAGALPGEGPAAAALPLALESVRLLGRPRGELRCQARLRRPEGEVGGGTVAADLLLTGEGDRAVAEVRGLHLKVVERDALSTAVPGKAVPKPDGAPALDGLVYEVRWRPAPAGEGDGTGIPWDEPGRWLLLAGGDLGEALEGALQARGQSCRRIPPPDGAPGSDPAATLASLLAEEDRPLAGVLHLWSLAAPAAEAPGGLEAAEVLGLESLRALARALAEGEAGPRLWAVTRGGQAVAPSEPVAVAQASVWGLGRVIAAELPELWGGLVDLDPEPPAGGPEEEAELVLAALGESLEHGQVALRGREARVPRLAASEAPAGPRVELRSDATYLVTGGLGALGLAVARWLVETGARHLALMGRSGARGAAAEAVEELQAAGARVEVLRGDVSREADVAAAVAAAGEALPPLAGVIHAAGVLDDGVIVRQDPERFAAVLAPKVRGAWNLHAATRGMNLELFVLVASLAAAVGPLGQGAYAAANAFLDALAHHRRREGKAALSVGWGPWGEAGMAAGGTVAGGTVAGGSRWGELGVAPLAPETALAALAALAASDAAHRVVADFDWPRFLERFPGRRALFAEVAPAVAPAPAASGQDAGSELVRRLAEAPPRDRRRLLTAHVREQVAGVMDLAADTALDPREGLFEAGLDSLMALDLRKRLEDSLGRPLPATVVFEHPSVEGLTGFVAGLLEEQEADGEGPEAEEDESQVLELLAEIEGLSDEDLDVELTRMAGGDERSGSV